jgi:two-component system response regulator HydG
MFEAADNGTFYLNEIADATSSFQAKLLEVIETRKVRRLGENKHLPVNFRLVAATNHDLKQRIEEGLFRSDLFHRLNEISIELPPLCERTGDIQQLLEHFLRTSGFDSNQDGDPDSINRLAVILARREWPGNVRQLRAEINRLLLTSNRNLKAMIELADETAAADPHQALLDALDAAGGNKSKAARALGIKESTLRYRLKKCQTSRHRGETD